MDRTVTTKHQRWLDGYCTQCYAAPRDAGYLLCGSCRDLQTDGPRSGPGFPMMGDVLRVMGECGLTQDEVILGIGGTP